MRAAGLVVGIPLALFVTRSRNGFKRYTPAEKDKVVLICSALSQLELPQETVPVLVEYMNVVLDPELLVTTVVALSKTRSPDAFEPVAGLLSSGPAIE